MFGIKLVLLLGLLSHAQCRTKNPVTKIIGSKRANIIAFPYVVSLQNAKGYHYCCGSIYNQWTIVTSALCARAHTNPSAIRIRYGSASLNEGGYLIGVKKYKAHPNFNYNTRQFDVGVLNTNVSMVFGDKAQRIFMAAHEPANGTLASIAGWGSFSQDTPTRQLRLRTANMRIISRTNCRSDFYGYTNVTPKIGSSMFCAGNPNAGPCYGDTGAPLVVLARQVGISSWGYRCASLKYPSVYTDVATVKSWIDNNAYTS